MPINVNEAVERIKKAGTNNVRAVPMPGHHVLDGQHQIEVRENAAWAPILTGVSKRIAEDLISQAVNRVILG